MCEVVSQILYAGPKIQVFDKLKEQTYAGSLKMLVSLSFILLRITQKPKKEKGKKTLMGVS